MTADEIKESFKVLPLDAEALEYIDYNAPRYACLLPRIRECRDSVAGATILDVGPSFLTALLAREFPNDRLFAMGLDSLDSRGGHFPKSLELKVEGFIPFDLNQAQYREKWLEEPKFDVVVASEVIEHLHTAPTLTVGCLGNLLKPGGYLIVSVPNAANLLKRLTLLRGKHPYEMIRENATNPGHFREYTIAELEAIGTRCGLSVVRVETHNYTMPMEAQKRHSFKGRMLLAVTKACPPSFHNNLIAIYRK